MDKINQWIASELGVGLPQVSAAVELLGEGASVPFIARYRKERTGGLDDTQLRRLEERLGYLRELEDRRATVLKSIEEQGKLTPDLLRSINAAMTKVELEDLYAPFKPKRRTKAQVAREAGLEGLTDALLANPALDPEAEGAKFIAADRGVPDVKTALEGARHILLERMGEEPALVGTLRAWVWSEGKLAAKVSSGKELEGAKFSDYFDFGQRIRDIPSHRALAMLRGRNEGVLDLDLDVAHEKGKPHPGELKVRAAFGIAERGRAADRWLGLEVAARALARCRPVGAAQRACGCRGDLGVFQEPEGFAPHRACGPARHLGARSGLSHGGEGRGGGQDGQVGGDGHNLSARAQARLARLARPPGGPVHAPWG